MQGYRLLGKGTYGAVYRHQQQPDRVVKCYKGEEEQGQIEYQSVREIALLRYLRNHPHIVTMREVVTQKLPEECTLGILMDYGGETLAQWTNRNRANRLARLACFPAIAVQLLATVSFLHKHNVMHRDLKPSNVLITTADEPHIRLCDFGMARVRQRRNSYQRCTLEYRPPELFVSNTNYTMGVDIWAAACVLYEVLRASPLFRGETEQQVFQNIIQTAQVPEGTHFDLQGINWAAANHGAIRLAAVTRARDDTLLSRRLAATQDLLNRMLIWEGRARPRAAVALFEFCQIYNLPVPQIGSIEKPFYKRTWAAPGREEVVRWFCAQTAAKGLHLRTFLLAVNLYDMALGQWFYGAAAANSSDSEGAMSAACLLLANKYHDVRVVPEGEFGYDPSLLWAWQRRLLERFSLEHLLLDDLLPAEQRCDGTCDKQKIQERAECHLRVLLDANLVGKNAEETRELVRQACERTDSVTAVGR